ncbi:SIR2-like protein [Roseiarcus fermentans]|uniref:SIR2-like protein n=1 Tax=Roseiarcus fermentans TaxID=1473586 RepID=A0A366FWM8_9HYPH|nr:SIR2 family protein [Roseiarcus fermentans]RBP18145.1 SIR2-like protein [Roseiarcus fermentans]
MAGSELVVDIPVALKQEVGSGNVALFLGAGASKGAAYSPPTPEMPLGGELRNLICDRFLNGESKDRTLSTVASYVNNEYGPGQLETWLGALLAQYRPSTGHLLLPKFRWQAIYTLNYDLLIEDAYKDDKLSMQQLSKWYKNDNSMDRSMRAMESPVPLYKLHGTIDQFSDLTAPIVLSQEGFLLWREGRERLYNRLRESIAEYPIVFAGTALGDPHIQELLNVETGRRPMQYMVDPYLNRHDEQLFSSKRITPIKASFDEFMAALDAAIPTINRRLTAIHAGAIQHSIQRFFRSNNMPTPQIMSFLTNNVEHVFAGIASTPLSPELFYKGESQSWSPIEQQLDFSRTNYESVMLKVLAIGSKSDASVDILAIKGVAGSGKSVFLRRVAYDLATTHGLLVLFCPPRAFLEADRIREIYEVTRLRLVVVIDHAADQMKVITDIADQLNQAGIPITMIVADSEAAWGSYIQDFGERLAFTFTLRLLEPREIVDLISRLERHHCLGILTDVTPEQRLRAFKEVADRQLLVALYQATQGKDLEKIILEEYERIAQPDAQELYLLVATLNQFRTPVRAGLIRRLTGVRFQDFERDFLGPLTGIVHAERDPILKDMVYRTRHPYIAEILFRNVLDTTSKQVNQYLRILDGMDPSYSSDYEALRKMVSYRNVRSLTASLAERRQILDAAEKATQADPFILQQRALLEMNDPKGNLSSAGRYLERALAVRPRDASLRHTKATLLQREAEVHPNQLERRAIRSDARAILRSLRGDHVDGYVASSTAALAIDEIEDLTKNPPSDAIDVQIVRLVEDAERAIRQGLAAAPDFDTVHLQASRLQKHFGDNEAAAAVLKRAITARPELEFVAVAYARAIRDTNLSEALSVVKGSLAHKPNSRALNEALFELLLMESDEVRPELWAPLRKSFTNEDGNVFMHVHALRHQFVIGDDNAYRKLIEAAEKMKVARREREKPRVRYRNPSSGDGRFTGRIAYIGETHGYATVFGITRNVYIRPDISMDVDLWDSLKRDDPITLNVEFSLKGAIGTGVTKNL